MSQMIPATITLIYRKYIPARAATPTDTTSEALINFPANLKQ